MGWGVTGGTERHYPPLAVLVHAYMNVLSLNVILVALFLEILCRLYMTQCQMMFTRLSTGVNKSISPNLL